MYSSNNLGVERVNYVRKESLKMLIVGPLFSFAMFYLSYISMSKWLAFFYLMSPIFLAMMFFLFVYAPVMMMMRQRKTVKDIHFDEGSVKLSTYDVLWLKQLNISVKRSDLAISKRQFSWYGAKSKKGLIIRLSDGTELYLVEDYFDDYDAICDLLTGGVK